MRGLTATPFVGAFGAAALALLVGTPALAVRCHSVPGGGGIGPHCGLDTQTEPPDPGFGDGGGCTEASIGKVPLFRKTHQCRPTETMVIYDISAPFPDNGVPGDHVAAGSTSYAILRASPGSPCVGMVDDVAPFPCANPADCPGEVEVPVGGYIIGCWSPPVRNGCRQVRFYSGGSACLHIAHQLLGPGCTSAPDLDCPNVSTEQIALDMPGTADRVVCGPTDPATSCRATSTSKQETFRLLFGGFCTTSNCANPGAAPVALPEPGPTCVSQWGQTALGYDLPPGRGIDAPGWYDWKTGAFKVDITTRMPTCGALGDCLGKGSVSTAYWDLSVVAVPRPGQQLPCIGATGCDPGTCAP
jgi:hypothetical protein